MPGNTVFLDTNGWLALMNVSDQLHQRADTVWQGLGDRGYSIVLTDWVIAETGNGLARTFARDKFATVAEAVPNNARCRVIFMNPALAAPGIGFISREDRQAMGPCGLRFIGRRADHRGVYYRPAF